MHRAWQREQTVGKEPTAALVGVFTSALDRAAATIALKLMLMVMVASATLAPLAAALGVASVTVPAAS